MNNTNPKRQAGAILLISLIILLVMTIVGIAAMSSVTLEGKMANNARNHKIAFQAAESALRVGEAKVQAFPEPPVPKDSGCNTACGDVWTEDGFYTNQGSYTADQSWLNVPGPGVKFVTDEEKLPEVDDNAKPLYAIEYVGVHRNIMTLGHQQDVAENEAKIHYRIIARGYGSDIRARAHLMSDYSRRY